MKFCGIGSCQLNGVRLNKIKHRGAPVSFKIAQGKRTMEVKAVFSRRGQFMMLTQYDNTGRAMQNTKLVSVSCIVTFACNWILIMICVTGFLFTRCIWVHSRFKHYNQLITIWSWQFFQESTIRRLLFSNAVLSTCGLEIKCYWLHINSNPAVLNGLQMFGNFSTEWTHWPNTFILIYSHLLFIWMGVMLCYIPS